MYTRGTYHNLNELQIIEAINKEGFDPLRLSDPPGTVYESHRHQETKLLVFLQGTMEVKVANEIFQCTPGDKLLIAGGVKHSAKVGQDGCVFFWSEKIISP